MAENPLHDQMRELSWRRRLTPAEETRLRTWLTDHPEAQTEWEAEAALTESLSLLPEPPVASNFTARVVQAVEQESRTGERVPGFQRRLGLRLSLWLPRFGLAAVFLSAAMLSYDRLKPSPEARQAASLKLVAEVVSLPAPKILEDFDAILALGDTPPADEELLRLLE